MSYLIVPSRVTATTATTWIASIDEAQRPTLFADGVALPAPPWIELAQGPHRLVYARVQLPPRAPRTRCDLQLRVGDRVVAVGSTTTLPAALPAANEQPFTVLLGSCFYVKNDRGAGRALLNGPRPDLKILCGDQVYLDAPWSHFLLHTHDRAEMERLFFETYQRTWEQTGPGAGFRNVMQDGANFLSSDDHEFWNNGPTFGSYVRDTWTAGGRRTWWDVAARLYGAFQNERTIERFSVGPLSFLLADTRLHRDSDRNRLMTDAEWNEVCGWVDGLQGPGVLVVGQPIFATQGGLTARFEDWSFPDFAQYQQLARALRNARHSVVVLTGDVHFGRVAYCQLPPSAGGGAPRLIEVISSPLALVDERTGGHWTEAPPTFPPIAVPGAPALPVTTVKTFQMRTSHFLTIELTGVAGGARMRVRSWPIVPDAGNPAGRAVFEDTLY
jgi:hypothetical protein